MHLLLFILRINQKKKSSSVVIDSISTTISWITDMKNKENFNQTVFLLQNSLIDPLIKNDCKFEIAEKCFKFDSPPL